MGRRQHNVRNATPSLRVARARRFVETLLRANSLVNRLNGPPARLDVDRTGNVVAHGQPGH
eukprot:231631-Lingulodinium_polyedra.AAC.1